MQCCEKQATVGVVFCNMPSCWLVGSTLFVKPLDSSFCAPQVLPPAAACWWLKVLHPTCLCHQMSKMFNSGNGFDFITSFVLFFAALVETVTSAKMSYNRIFLHVKDCRTYVCQPQPRLCSRCRGGFTASAGTIVFVIQITALYCSGWVRPCCVNPFPTGPNRLF